MGPTPIGCRTMFSDHSTWQGSTVYPASVARVTCPRHTASTIPFMCASDGVVTREPCPETDATTASIKNFACDGWALLQLRHFCSCLPIYCTWYRGEWSFDCPITYCMNPLLTKPSPVNSGFDSHSSSACCVSIPKDNVYLVRQAVLLLSASHHKQISKIARELTPRARFCGRLQLASPRMF